MNGCGVGGPLLGGYVLDALEPREMEQMRRHLDECAACRGEVGDMSGLPGLLSLIEPADVPPPALAPEVEEQVLDRFAQERRRERPRRRRRAFLTPRRIAALGVACAAALALALALVWPAGDNGNQSYASALLKPARTGATASGKAYASQVMAGTRVTLWARHLPARSGVVYELWCVRANGRWVSGGTFRPRHDGRAYAELTAAVRPGDYHVMIVTRHAEGAPEGAHGATVMRGQLRY
jgi:predicted anti-sigma-YlaC factor YlaD